VKSDKDYVTTGAVGHSSNSDELPQPEAPEYLYSDEIKGYEYELMNTAVRSIGPTCYQIYWTWKLVFQKGS
jgi:hypothetical protein